MRSVTINGLDGSGKSQQCRVLGWNDELHLTKPLIQYNHQWPQLTGVQASEWWFSQVSSDELTRIIIDALNLRNRDTVKGKTSVHDRGTRMFMAVCAATRMVRDGLSLEASMDATDRQFVSLLDYAVQEVDILLEPDEGYFSRQGRYIEIIRPAEDMAFPEATKERYFRYRRNLAAAMDAYLGDKCWRIRVDRPIIFLALGEKVEECAFYAAF